jgi:hypothetical protein
MVMVKLEESAFSVGVPLISQLFLSMVSHVGMPDVENEMPLEFAVFPSYLIVLDNPVYDNGSPTVAFRTMLVFPAVISWFPTTMEKGRDAPEKPTTSLAKSWKLKACGVWMSASSAGVVPEKDSVDSSKAIQAGSGELSAMTA